MKLKTVSRRQAPAADLGSKLSHLNGTSANNDKVERLVELLGPTVLLPWPAGSKGGDRKWMHRRLTDMNDDTYLAKLKKAGNIGVALGRVSNGLVSIDIDDDNYADAFLQANPLFTNTLRTAAERGCNIWLRCRGEYPPSGNLTDLSGTKIGEWRADGNQTIIAGIHPEGMPYRFVIDKPVITIDYKSIVWPADLTVGPATESRRVRRVKRVRENEVVCVGVCEQIQAYFTTDLISQIAPRDFQQNNHSLFQLARSVRSCENAADHLATDAELEFVFDLWCLIARRFWRSELTRDDYYAEFLEAYSYARIGLDENPIDGAVSRAKRAPLPGVRGFSDERIRLLAAICREMQSLTGGNPFFLPTRKLGEVLDVHWTRIARWLRALECLQFIRLAPGEVRKRGGDRSPRYLCGPPLQVGAPSIAPLSTHPAHARGVAHDTSYL